MTKAEAEKQFRETVLPVIKQKFEQDGRPDYPARREGWNNWTDALCKEGTITTNQYSNWANPF